MIALNRWCVAGMLMLVSMIAPPLSAQGSGDGIALIATATYVVFSYRSVARLTEGARRTHVGDSLRAVVRDGQTRAEHRGRVIEMTADSLTLLDGGERASFPMSSVARMDVYLGQESKSAQGWALGWLSGATIGALAGYAQGDDPPNCDIICLNAGTKAVLLGVFGGVAGSSVGTLVGALAQGDHWQRARRFDGSSFASRVSIAPVIGRTNGLAARVSF